MNRIVSIIAATILTISLTACGGSSQAATTEAQPAENGTPAVAEAQTETETAEVKSQDAAEPETKQEETTQQTEAKQDAAQETVQETEAEPTSEEPAAAAHSEVLVAYFSATGTTKGVAERIASVTGGDLYEILAAQPYTEADLNYNDDSSRTTTEQNDKSVRPEIGSEDISLEGYTTIYLGFPIWWGEEPRILDTFVEKYEFDGITVIPFCTSGSSGIGRSGPNMEELAGSGTWLQGERFSGNVSEEELKSWIEGLQ